MHFAYYTLYKLLHKNNTTPLYSQRKYIIRTFVGYIFFSTSVTPFVTPFVTPMQFSCKTKSTVLCTFRIVVWRSKFRPSEACRLWDIYRTQPMSHKWLYFVHTYARALRHYALFVFMVHYRHKKSGQISADMPFLLVLEHFSVLCKHFLSWLFSWLLVACIALACRVCVWCRICDWRGWYFGRFCGRFSVCIRLAFERSSCGINICHSICV